MPFFTWSKKGIQIYEPCWNFGDEMLEIALCEILLHIDTYPSKMGVRGIIQVVCCENVHRCNKEQACLKKIRFFM